MRGEYRRHDGLVLPNSFTDLGLRAILVGAFRNEWPVGVTIYVGLCKAVPARDLTLAQVIEPTIGINGYARQPLTRDAVAWPGDSSQNGDPFLETSDIIFTATGGPFDQGVTRMFLTPAATGTIGQLWALSAAMQTELVVDVATPLPQRTFNYRVYGV